MPTLINSEKLVWTSGSSCDGGRGVTVGTRSDMHPVLSGNLKASQGRPDNFPVDPEWAHAYMWDPEPSPGLPIV